MEKHGKNAILTEKEKQSLELYEKRDGADTTPEDSYEYEDYSTEGVNDNMQWVTYPRKKDSPEFAQVYNRILELKVFETVYDDVMKEYRKSLKGK